MSDMIHRADADLMISQGDIERSSLGQRITGLLFRIVDAVVEMQRRRANRVLLMRLDNRTLQDVGIDPAVLVDESADMRREALIHRLISMR